MDYNFALFNAITDAINTLEELKQKLVDAQQKAEDIYIDSAE